MGMTIACTQIQMMASLTCSSLPDDARLYKSDVPDHNEVILQEIQLKLEETLSNAAWQISPITVESEPWSMIVSWFHEPGEYQAPIDTLV